jgi:putative ABC transport system substrate-binding protein
MPVMGFLRSTDLPQYATGFRQGLREAGFVEGQNVAIEYRFTRIKLTGWGFR